MSLEISPIADAEMDAVADFLHAISIPGFHHRYGCARCPCRGRSEAPNHGFMLRDGDRVVGVHLAFYSERVLAGQAERFCNLGAWCVLPEFRLHSLKLLRALLAQDGYHFTDLSPSGTVVPLNARLAFRSLDTSTALVPNLPWPTLGRRTRISADPDVIESMLTGADLALYQDHAHAAAARHLVLIQGNDSCYVMFRNVSRKNLPVFAAILYVSNPDLFRRSHPPADTSSAYPSPCPGDSGRAADRRVPATPIAYAVLSKAQDVPQSSPGTGTDRRPLQRARMRPLVAGTARSSPERCDTMRIQIHHLIAEAAGVRRKRPRGDIQGCLRHLRPALGRGAMFRRCPERVSGFGVVIG